MSKLLEFKELVIGHTKPLLHPIDLTLSQGKIHVLLGANGSGKSTLLKTLAGILSPLSGDIFFKGENISTLTQQKRAKVVSIVLTDRDFFPTLTVFETVMLGRLPHLKWFQTDSAQDKKIVYKYLEKLSLLNFENSPLTELSDGTLQRVFLARALAQETEIVLLDEPTIFLDLAHREKLLSLLSKLAQEEGRTILFTTHDLYNFKEEGIRVLTITRDQQLTECKGTSLDLKMIFEF